MNEYRSAISNEIVESVLERCRPYLASLSLPMERNGNSGGDDKECEKILAGLAEKTAPKLISLDLTSFFLSQASAVALSNLKKLEVLKIVVTRCPEDDLIKLLESLTNLKTFHYKGFPYKFLEHINWQKIEELNIELGDYPSNFDFLTSAPKPALKSLTLLARPGDESFEEEEDDEEEEIPLPLRQLFAPNLKMLRLDCKCQDLPALAQLGHLEKLHLNEVFVDPAVAENTLSSLSSQDCPNRKKIRVLELGNNDGLSENALKMIAGFPNLDTLSLDYVVSTSSDVIATIVPKCPKLAYLSLAFCKNLDDTSFGPLQHSSALEFLDISGCKEITDSVSNNNIVRDVFLPICIWPKFIPFKIP